MPSSHFAAALGSLGDVIGLVPLLGVMALPTSSASASGTKPAAPRAADEPPVLAIAASWRGSLRRCWRLRLLGSIAPGLDALANRIGAGADSEQSQDVCGDLRKLLSVFHYQQEKTECDNESENKELEPRHACGLAIFRQKCTEIDV